MQKGAAYSAAVLASANIACKILGFLYKVPLANLIGGEGMGYFSFSYQIFHIVSVIAVSGVPLTLARSVAARCARGKEGECRGLLKAVLLPLALIGTAGTAILMFFAAPITVFAGAEKAAGSLRALAPAAMFIALSGAARGYLQGKNDLAPIAAAQFIESAVKLVLGVAAAYWFWSRGAGPELIAAGAVAGVAAGAGFGCLWLLIRSLRGGPSKRCRGAGREIFLPALPVTLGALMLSFIGAADASMTVSLLRASGETAERAAALYGVYTGYAMTMFSFPAALTGAVTSAAMPVIAGAAALGDRKRVARAFSSSMRALAAVAFPAAAIYFALPGPVMTLLFSRASDVAAAAPLLKILSVGVALSAFASSAVSALQSMGKTFRASAAMTAGALCKLGFNALLIPRVGIAGAALSNVAGCAVILAFSAGFLRMGFGGGLVRPLLCSLPAGAAGYAVCSALSGRFAAVPAIAAAGTVYLSLMFVCGGLTSGDLGYIRIKKRNGKKWNSHKNNDMTLKTSGG